MFARTYSSIIIGTCYDRKASPNEQPASCARLLDCSLQDGVVKLEETGKIVKGLKRELTQLQPLLESKAMEAEGLLKQVRSLQHEKASTCLTYRRTPFHFSCKISNGSC